MTSKNGLKKAKKKKNFHLKILKQDLKNVFITSDFYNSQFQLESEVLYNQVNLLQTKSRMNNQ